jgi:voltage-gated potassium channel
VSANVTGPSDESPFAAQSVLFMVLRRLRTPLLVLVLSYAVSVFGLTLVPGIDASGEPAPPMSFFHAFYFVSYTATTIGFGELPQPFSEAQRLWAIVIIHLAVISWTYALLHALSLFQDRAFQRAVAQIRLARKVRRMREPFHLICGASDTGRRLVGLLDRLDMRFVVIDEDEQRIEALELEELRVDAPILHGDPRLPHALLSAGLRHPLCRGVLAVTRNDDTNLAIATAARLLNRAVPVIAGAQSARTVASLQAFGTHHVINPFETFADNLVLAMRAPGCYRLVDWLTAPLDARLEKEHAPPRGAWVVCGYGRFGRAVVRRLLEQGLPVVAVDLERDDERGPLARLDLDANGRPDVAALDSDGDRGAEGSPGPERPSAAEAVQVTRLYGTGTEPAVLERAGIAQAVGLVAATDNDVSNLAIAALARSLNQRVFMVLRQNEAANQVLFDNFPGHLVMQPSEIVADECVALLTTPLLARFLSRVRSQTDGWADEAIHQLRKRVGTRSPRAWTLRIDAEETPAACRMLEESGQPLLLGDLLRAPGERDARIEARALMILREGRELLLPGDDTALQVGDRILLAGRSAARRQLNVTACDANVLRYACTGQDTPGGLLFRAGRRARAPARRSTAHTPTPEATHKGTTREG